MLLFYSALSDKEVKFLLDMPVQCSRYQRQFCFVFLILVSAMLSTITPPLLCLHLWPHLPILHFKCYDYKFPRKPPLFFFCVRHKSCGPYNKPANHRGFLLCFWGSQHHLQHHPQVCKRSFFCMSNFCFSCSSFLPPLLILIWKCPIAFI